jgi:hypothetical protein
MRGSSSVPRAKSVLVGVCTAVLAVIAWIAASVSIDLREGTGSASVALETRWVTLAALAGFIAGFWLHRRLVTRRRG